MQIGFFPSGFFHFQEFFYSIFIDRFIERLHNEPLNFKEKVILVVLYTILNFKVTHIVLFSVCIMGAVYTMICVPETKGKTLQEIEEYFKKPVTTTQQPPIISQKL